MLATIGSVEGIDGQLHHSDYHRANAFNDFFSSVFTDEIPIAIFTIGRGGIDSGLVPYYCNSR